MGLTRADCKRLNIPWPEAEPEPERRRGRMNGLETRFAQQYLDPMKAAGIITGYAFESVRLLIADADMDHPRAYFTTDFVAWGPGVLNAYDTKGHQREAARLRIKVAAERHPYYKFMIVRYEGRWMIERFGGQL